MPTIMIVMWILSALVFFLITSYFWWKKDKENFNYAGMMFLACLFAGFITGWLFLAVVIYILIIQRFENEEN